MKSLVSAQVAGGVMLVSFAALLIFHVAVLAGFVPTDIIWGGQVTNTRTGVSGISLQTIEIAALVITALFGFIVASKLSDLRKRRPRTSINVGVWVLFWFLVLNTLGNLSSASSLEALIFVPVTVILAFCAWRVAVEKG